MCHGSWGVSKCISGPLQLFFYVVSHTGSSDNPGGALVWAAHTSSSLQTPCKLSELRINAGE